MTAEVPNILAQLAAIQVEIANPETSKAVVSYENVPYTISAYDMPLFVNLAGPLLNMAQTGSDEIAREFAEVRNFKMNLYHSPYASGIEGEKYRLLAPYFPLVYVTFGKYPHLKGLAGALDARIMNDTGITVLQFNGTQYFGVSFTLQVTSKVRRVYGENE